MTRIAVLTILILFFVTQAALLADGSKSSAAPGPSKASTPPAPRPNPEDDTKVVRGQRESGGGDDEEKGHTPVGAYMLAAVGVALVLVIVCMPSRKGN